MVKANIINADFGHNFFNAVGAQDEDLTTDLIMNEIAQLVNDKPMTLIQTMSSIGYAFKGQTRADLVKAVTQLIQYSPKFRVAISTLIAVNNGLVSYAEVEDAGLGNMAAFRISRSGYHNDEGGAKGGGAGAGAGGGDFISAIIGAVGNITSSSLQLAAAKANQKSTTIAAQSGLEQAKINSDSMENTSKESTRQELLKTLGIKMQSAGSKIPGWVILLGVVALACVVGFFVVGKGGEAVMPAPTPAAPSTPAPPAPQPAAQHQQGGAVAAPATPPMITFP